MPKGIELSSNAATLPPPKNNPAPKAKPEGEQSFDHALKQARPKPAAKDDSPAKANPCEAAAPTDVETPSDAIDPGVTQKPIVQVEIPLGDVAVANALDLETKPAAKEDLTVDAQLPEFDLIADQIITLEQPIDAPVEEIVEEQQSPEPVIQPVIQPVIPGLVKATPTPDLDVAPVELPQARQTEKPVVRNAPIALPDEVEVEEDTEPASKQIAEIASKAVASVPKSVDEEAEPVPAPDEIVATKPNPLQKQVVEPEIQPSPQPETTDALDAVVQTALRPETTNSTATPAIDLAAPISSAPASAPIASATVQVPVRPELDFAAANHDRIVTSVRTQLLPDGGTMQLRLDPPDLGPLQVTVHMTDALSASFETSNSQATQLLSHSLSQLKTALETQGMSVEKLHVAQAPREQQSDSRQDKQERQESQQQQESARREQQRRELLNRMWRRMGLVNDPLDLVA